MAENKLFKVVNRKDLIQVGYWYLLPTLFSLSSLYLVYFVNIATGGFSYQLVTLMAVILSTWFGGLKGGLFSTVLTLAGMFYLFQQPFPIFGLGNLMNDLLYLTLALGFTFLIHKHLHLDLIIQYRRDINKLTDELLTSKLEEIKAKNEVKARDEFLSVASHELKTPLTSMLLQIQGALHNIKNVSLANFSVENLLKMLESVEQQTDRLSKMINDLLNVSLITTGKIDLEIETIDLSKTVKDVTQSFSEKLAKDSIILTLEADKEVVGSWDKRRIEQVISNLITNAIKYGAGKPIEVKVYNSGNTGKILVKDQGIGINKDDQKRVFSKFERASNTGAIQGFGVGLYITNQIIEAHGGKIHLDSKENQGSTFLIELPLDSATRT